VSSQSSIPCMARTTLLSITPCAHGASTLKTQLRGDASNCAASSPKLTARYQKIVFKNAWRYSDMVMPINYLAICLQAPNGSRF